MRGKDILSMKEMSKEDILYLLDRAEKIKSGKEIPNLKGAIMASCFFEPSTRTRLSFESAMKRFGGDVIGFSDGLSTSSAKGETIHDSVKVIGNYADVLVIRHPLEGTAKRAADATEKPIINAGDGANEHPTQTLLDLFTIREAEKKLENLHIAFVGDLLYGRTAHSLALAFRHFGARLYFVSPSSLAMPHYICQELKKTGIPFSFHSSMEEIMDKIDILYMTRIQKERFANLDEYAAIKDKFILHPDLFEARAKSNLKILHPLPRVNEIDISVDTSQHAFYFEQAANGLPVRAALLAEVLGR